MQAMKETTKWNSEFRVPNHTYIFDGVKAVAYIREGEFHPYIFKTPLDIDRRGRTFKQVPLPAMFKDEPVNVVRVQGSKGQVYEVTVGDRPTCTCPSFQFRGQCKHIEQVRN